MTQIDDFSAMGVDIAIRGQRLSEDYRALAAEADILMADALALADALNKSSIAVADKTAMLVEIQAFADVVRRIFAGKS